MKSPTNLTLLIVDEYAAPLSSKEDKIEHDDLPPAYEDVVKIVKE